jgi:hypothetical protein
MYGQKKKKKQKLVAVTYVNPSIYKTIYFCTQCV